MVMAGKLDAFVFVLTHMNDGTFRVLLNVFTNLTESISSSLSTLSVNQRTQSRMKTMMICYFHRFQLSNRLQSMMTVSYSEWTQLLQSFFRI